MSSAEKAKVGPSFWKAVAEGRQNTKAYFDMLIRFGDIFSKERVGKGKSFVRKIASGVKISDLITHNMEAFMRTVLSVGCSHDWPNYLKSDKWAHSGCFFFPNTLIANAQRHLILCS